jgi:hypothetical protein
MRLAAQITGFFRCMSMSVFAIQNFKIRGKTLPTYWNRTFLLLACQTQVVIGLGQRYAHIANFPENPELN